MSGITAFALNYQRIVMIFIVMIIVLGALQYSVHPRLEDPAIVIREAVVTAALPGLEPGKVEDLITRRLEEKIRTMEEVDDITSVSKTGVSTIHVTLRDEVSSDSFVEIWHELRNRVADVKPDLPEGTQGPEVNDEFGETAVATIALWSDGFTLAEMRIVARDIRDHLYALDGVKKVELYGVQDEQVFLEFSNAKLAEFGIDPSVIVRTLRDQNVILPAGSIDTASRDFVVEASGNFDSVEDIRDLLIPIPGTESVANLLDVVTISRGYVDPPVAPVYYNGRPAIVLSVSMLGGFNAVEFGERLKARIAEMDSALPVGYVLDFATYQPKLVERAVNGALLNVYETLGIVLVVVMLFLGLRTGLIVGSFVPLAMLLGLIVMGVMGVDLQRMSIASMIIALGMLVDNAIVVAEDIRTRLEQGADRKRACLEAGRTLAVPLLTSTLTTVFAFMPMVLIAGSTGEYVLSLGQVVITLLLGSWLLSMFVTPAMCFWFMKVKTPKAGEAQSTNEDELYSGRFYRVYRGFLELVLRARLAVIAVSIGGMVAAAFGFQLVVKEFFPPGDRNQFLTYIDLPAGANINTTEAIVREYAAWLGNEEVNPDVTGNIAYVGAGGPRFFLSLSPIDPDPNVAFVIVNTETAADVPTAVERSRRYFLEDQPDVRGRVKSMWLGATETGLVEIRLSGPDAEELFANAARLVDAFEAIPGTLDVRQDWENQVIKLVVAVDQSRARRAGVTSRQVALSLETFIDGSKITDYREGDVLIPIVIQAVEEERSTLGGLRDINVYAGGSGVNIPLSQIADFEGQWEFSRISRYDQERTVTVEAKHQYLKAGQLFAAIQPALDALDFGPGGYWEVGGELEDSAEAQQKLFGNMPFAALGIVLLLIWQFNSFRRTAIILLTIPLSLIGGVLGLIVMNSVFGFMTILGVFSLAGIIINNGIVLIDRIDSEIADGRQPYDAVMMSALARFRPILMSTLTTILGLLPLIVSRDPLFYGMASLIAFGLLIGTVLTLGIVPVLYTLFFRVPIPKRGAPAQPAPQPA